MNVDLSVRCAQEFTVGDLCYHSGQAMMEILGLTQIPDLSVEVDEGDKQYLAEKEFICGTQCPYLLVGFKDIPGKVKLLLYDMPLSSVPPGEDPGLRATVLVAEGGNRTAESLALAVGASLAMALSRMEETPIQDKRLFFGQKAELSPEELRRALRQHGLFRDIQAAAQQMFFHTPLSAFEPEALRALQIEEQIDKVMVEMLGLVKIKKKVDTQLFSKFYALLDEAISGQKMDEERRKNLLGLLLLVYEFLAEESKKMSDPRPASEEAKRVRDKIISMGFELSSYAMNLWAVGLPKEGA